MAIAPPAVGFRYDIFTPVEKGVRSGRTLLLHL